MLISRNTDSESCPAGATRLSLIIGATPTANPATSSTPGQPSSSRRAAQTSSSPATARYGTISQSDQSATPASSPNSADGQPAVPDPARRPSATAISSIASTAGFTSGPAADRR